MVVGSPAPINPILRLTRVPNQTSLFPFPPRRVGFRFGNSPVGNDLPPPPRTTTGLAGQRKRFPFKDKNSITDFVVSSPFFLVMFWCGLSSGQRSPHVNTPRGTVPVSVRVLQFQPGWSRVSTPLYPRPRSRVRTFGTPDVGSVGEG